MSRKQRDYATVAGISLIVLGLLVIGGIAHTYMTRPALIEAAQKRVLDIRQVFEDIFHRQEMAQEAMNVFLRQALIAIAVAVTVVVVIDFVKWEMTPDPDSTVDVRDD